MDFTGEPNAENSQRSSFTVIAPLANCSASQDRCEYGAIALYGWKIGGEPAPSWLVKISNTLAV